MRIAAISDVHGNLAALSAVLSDIAACSPDVIVNLGDHLSGPLLAKETADLLMRCAHSAIRGNHDRQLLTQVKAEMSMSDRAASAVLTEEHHRWLTSLPANAWLDGSIFLCHGTPKSDCEYLLERVGPSGARHSTRVEVTETVGDLNASLILCGHSHIARAVRLLDGRLVVNPGSVGLQAYCDDDPYPHCMEMGTPHARYAILEKGSNWSVDFIKVPYDWTMTADLAEAAGRLDWSEALRTGRLPA